MKNILLKMCAYVYVLGISTAIYGFNIKKYNVFDAQVAYDNCNMRTNGELNVIKNLIRNQTVVFDIGANKGEWLEHVLACHDIAQLYAFEPQKQEYNMLMKKFNRSSSVHIYKCAVSDQNSKQKMYRFDHESGLTSFFNRPILSMMFQKKPLEITVETVFFWMNFFS